MTINKTIKVEAEQAVSKAKHRHLNQEQDTDEGGTVDKSIEVVDVHGSQDFEGRKHKSEIDGPQQDSQETDEVYADPRHEADLPPAGKNAAELNANDLSKEANKR